MGLFIYAVTWLAAMAGGRCLAKYLMPLVFLCPDHGGTASAAWIDEVQN